MTTKSVMTIEDARGWAASAWCDEPNAKTAMDTNLAESFAQILVRCLENAESSRRITAARQTFRDVFADDSQPGGFYDAYVSNVAMLLHDRYGITDHETRNRAAREILRLIFGEF